MSVTTDPEAIREAVRDGYGRVARETQACCGPEASCCGESPADALARKFGYDAAELALLPEGANMGLSCGNPTAMASLRPGEVVLDLGSGGGFDVFIAGQRVGPNGRAIGVDMTPDMLAKARRNAKTYAERTGFGNVEFRLGEIEHLPVADNSVDVVISNCVINLSPDKPQVWHEIARVLKPGGRVSVSDIHLLQPLPEALAARIDALVGCIAGAVLVEETERMIAEAGLIDCVLERDNAFVEVATSSSDPLHQEALSALPPGTTAADYITSLYITARKAE